jgi:hypothetical protein
LIRIANLSLSVSAASKEANTRFTLLVIVADVAANVALGV